MSQRSAGVSVGELCLRSWRLPLPPRAPRRKGANKFLTSNVTQQFQRISRHSTLPPTNMAPVGGYLEENEFPLLEGLFRCHGEGRSVSSWRHGPSRCHGNVGVVPLFPFFGPGSPSTNSKKGGPSCPMKIHWASEAVSSELRWIAQRCSEALGEVGRRLFLWAQGGRVVQGDGVFFLNLGVQSKTGNNGTWGNSQAGWLFFLRQGALQGLEKGNRVTFDCISPVTGRVVYLRVPSVDRQQWSAFFSSSHTWLAGFGCCSYEDVPNQGSSMTEFSKPFNQICKKFLQPLLGRFRATKTPPFCVFALGLETSG